jgi:hypothetical protein
MSAPNAQAKTIQIFLPSGEPRGIRIAELTTRIVQAVLIPRSDLAGAKLRSELDHLAIYFLFGESENSAKPIVYIGQTEDVRTRLGLHNSNKDFWRTAVLGISRTHSFTQAHIRYLEWLCVAKAKENNRFDVENNQIPGKPFVTEPMEADLLDAFETLSVLLATLGFPVFDPIIKSESAEKFSCQGKGADATGELTEDGFVVRKGSIARIDIVPSGKEAVESIRRPLIEGGVVQEKDGQLIFTQDYLFSSPSSAAMAVMGRTANGWIEWKNKDGKTLHDARRAGTDE